MPVKYIILIFGVLVSEVSFAQTVIKAIRIEEPPYIDGHVNDSVWGKAVVADKFFQREPNEGAPVSEKTQFFICYDLHNIYIGLRCYDDPENVTAKEMARDVSLESDDRIQIILDTYLDRRNAYWFQISPRGSIGDALVSENGAGYNKKWDGIWTGKAAIKDYGWEAEIAIPFKTLGFDKSNTQWGIKFIRYIVNKLEVAYWPQANLNTHRFQVSDAAILDGIKDISQGIGLDVLPYMVTGIKTKKDEKWDPRLTGGVDMFYRITPSLRSSLTINTDFAETEVDDRQINLTRFNLHFPEKRGFFLDGANYFQFGIESDWQSPVAQKIIPFFSRRIGLDENGIPIPINYGAKIAGQLKSWNIGLLHINDKRETGIENFSVARITKNIGKQSSIGFISTYGNALSDSTNLLAGADIKLSSSNFQGNKNISFLFFGLKSQTKSIANENNAWGAQFNYPNDLLKARLGYHQIGKNFIAGMGFVPRINIKETYGDVEFGPRPNKWGIMQIQFGGTFNNIQNKETLDLETRTLQIKPIIIRLLSGEKISYYIINQSENLIADFNIFDDLIISKSRYDWWRHEFNLLTKGARNLWGDLTYGFGDFYNGSRQDIKLKLNWKIAVPFFLGGNFIHNYVQLPQGSFNANIYQINANILFDPDITLYNFIQYDNVSQNTGWQSRFHWILQPGKEIILVWNALFSETQNHSFLKESSLNLKLKYNIRF